MRAVVILGLLAVGGGLALAEDEPREAARAIRQLYPRACEANLGTSTRDPASASTNADEDVSGRLRRDALAESHRTNRTPSTVYRAQRRRRGRGVGEGRHHRRSGRKAWEAAAASMHSR